MTRLLYYWAICLEDQILPLDSRLEATSIPRLWCAAIEKAGQAAYKKMSKKQKKQMKNRPPPVWYLSFLLKVRYGTSQAYDLDSPDYLLTVLTG